MSRPEAERGAAHCGLARDALAAPRPHVVIAGAGIGGLAAAILLARGHWQVTLVERAPRPRGEGAGVQLSSNAMRALARLDLAGRAAGAACRPRGLDIRALGSGRILARMPLGALAEQRYGAPWCVIRRAALHNVLLEAARAESRISIHFGCAAVRAVINDGRGNDIEGRGRGRGGASVTLAGPAHGNTTGGPEGHNGQNLSCDLVIGADGAASQIRNCVTGAAHPGPRPLRHVAYRSMVAVPARLCDTVNLWLGRGAHIVAYAVDDRAMNLVAITPFRDVRPEGRNASPGCRNGLPGRWSRPACIKEVIEGLGKISPDMRALLHQAEGWRQWRLASMAPLKKPVRGPVVLIGDAAHVTPPFIAQGAAMALEDAVTLGDLLNQPRPVSQALDMYAGARYQRLRRVHSQAHRNRHVFHLAPPFSMARDHVLAMRSGPSLLNGFDWLYEWAPINATARAGYDSGADCRAAQGR